MQYINRLFMALLFSGLVISAAGCNTISGIGEDMQAAGRAIENKAEEIGDNQD